MSSIFNDLLPEQVAGGRVAEDGFGWIGLHSLHKAMAGERHKSPAEWIQTEGSKSLIKVAQKEVAGFDGLRTDEGGEVFAPEVVAISYASWINASFLVMVLRAYTRLRNGKTVLSGGNV